MFNAMIKLDSTTKRLLQDPDKRRAWVKYQIHLTGRSMAQVADAAGVNRQTLYSAFFKTYPRMEKVIADALGLPPAVVFPDRYDADGLPIYRMGRPKKSTSKQAKDTTRTGGRNVQSRAPDKQGRAA
jgi:Ner family transcriptional regulator